MDALLRRPLTAAAVLFAIGCESTDAAKVSGFTQGSALARGQSPPGAWQPPAPVVPISQPAPVVPVSGTTATTTDEPTPEKGTTQVRAV
ncbi:MAG: hypothetical protein ACRC7O_14745, partial [Fimbriiglobus sp.]